jgi:ABC-type transport system substrate-binding protein
MRAAGFYGLETEFSTNASGTADYKRRQDVFAQMLQQGGHFKLKIASYDYNTVYNPKYYFGKLQWEGIATVPFGSWPDIFEGMWAIYSPTGRNDYVYKEVPKAHETMIKVRTERDDKKRVDLVHQWQKEMAVEMPTVPEPGVWTTFALFQPWVGNAGYITPYISLGRSVEEYPHWWLDKSKDTRTA